MDRSLDAPDAEPPGTVTGTVAPPMLSGRPLFPATVKERERGAAFPASERSRAFRRKFFADASAADWNDWRWQLQHRIRDLRQLSKFIRLSDDEHSAVARHTGPLPVGITPYYASLLSEDDPAQPLRRTHIPVNGEYLRTPGEADDPLGEDHDAAVPGVVHRYPDRVLFLATGFCSTYCRYCTRSRMVGGGGEYAFSTSQWQRGIDYIAATPAVRDVLLSGGDPLTIATDKLEWLLSRLRAIPHLDFIRIGTKVPVVLPQRITRDLTRMLRRYHPLWMSIHFTHPDEFTPEVAESTARLADAGIPLGGQTVLLKGINDELPVMRALMHGMLKNRVKPYYLYQCDPITGSSHFRTTVEKGLEIIAGLRGHTTGYAVPHFVVDAPGGGGKIPLLPDYLVGRDGEDLVLRNFEGGLYRYHDPDGTLAAGRPVAAEDAARAKGAG